MSTVPVINRVYVLPTLHLAFDVTPPTVLTGIGPAILSYTVTIAGTSYTGRTFRAGDKGFHQIASVGQVTRGASVSVTVRAVGAVGGATSDAVVEVCNPGASRAETIRQRLFEVVDAAALTQGGSAVVPMSDAYGRPDTIKAAHRTPQTSPCVVEVGVAESIGIENVATGLSVERIEVPVTVTATAMEADDGAKLAQAVAGKLRAALVADYNRDLGLAGFGVVPGSVDFGPQGEAQQAKDGRSAAVKFMVTVPAHFDDAVVLA